MPRPRAFALMGIVNATPDSFSDGGLFLDPGAAIAHGQALVREGATIIDVGGESTRPGATPVPAEQERDRVASVIEGLAAAGLDAEISIDTSKVLVAQAALAAGARLVNDVTAFRSEPALAGLVADHGARCCLMHMLGEPRTMQDAPHYDDVVDDVRAFLEERLAFAVGEGIAEERILLDPGIGFGKTDQHNLELLARLPELVAIGRPVVVGTSRKGFLGRLAARRPDARGPAPRERLAGTIATCVMAFERGASVLRVHDVAPVYDALAVAAATLTGPWTARSTPTTPTT
jgi:dihydropteroate synthase